MRRKDQPGAVYLASFESYLVMNQPVPTKPGEAQRRRFLQLRAHLDVRVSAAVHNIELEPGGNWFSTNAVDTGAAAPDGLKYLQCTIGEGAAATLGEDAGKKRLAVGDTFELGDRWWKVTGIMNTRGTTYGSEVWTSVENTVVRASGKGDKFTTMVLRMADDSDASAKAMAYFLNELYTEAKLKAFAEPDYYKELTKTNEQFLTAIVMVAHHHGGGGRVRRHEHDVRLHRGADQGGGGAAHPRVQALANPDLVHAGVAGHRAGGRVDRLRDRGTRQRLRGREHALGRARGAARASRSR